MQFQMQDSGNETFPAPSSDQSAAAISAPVESGVVPVQKVPALIDADLKLEDPRQQNPLSYTFRQIASASSQNARTSYLLAQAATQMMEAEASAAKVKIAALEQKLEEQNERYRMKSEEVAVLKERLRTSDLVTVMLSLGFLILGCAISMFLSTEEWQKKAAPMVVLAGILIVLSALVVPAIRKSK